MKYMLDTNICIGLIRQKPQKLIRRLTRCEPGEVGVSSITIAELAHGAGECGDGPVCSHPPRRGVAKDQRPSASSVEI